MKKISIQLKTLRQNNKLSQSEMAKILGVQERGAVSLYESGKRNITLEQYFMLLEHFGESAYQVFGMRLSNGINDAILYKDNSAQLIKKLQTELDLLKSKYIACLEAKDKLK
jgi:transcriptional regulator with XRE-family HTH domain